MRMDESAGAPADDHAGMPEPAACLPHEGDAVLLEAIRADGPAFTRASAIVRTVGPFGASAGWPAWMVVEVMAQVVAAGAGLREFRPGIRPRLGLLLGVREFSCRREFLVPGTRVSFEVVEGMRDASGLGVFDCTAAVDGEPIASAILSVYLPDDVDTYLRSLEP